MNIERWEGYSWVESNVLYRGHDQALRKESYFHASFVFYNLDTNEEPHPSPPLKKQCHPHKYIHTCHPTKQPLFYIYIFFFSNIDENMEQFAKFYSCFRDISF